MPKPVFINWRETCYLYYYDDSGRQIKAHVGGVLLVPQGRTYYAHALIQNQGDPGWVTFRVVDRKTKTELASTSNYMNYLGEWTARLTLGTSSENIFAYPDTELQLQTLSNEKIIDTADIGVETRSWADFLEQIPRAGYLGIPWWIWVSIGLIGAAKLFSSTKVKVEIPGQSRSTLKTKLKTKLSQLKEKIKETRM